MLGSGSSDAALAPSPVLVPFNFSAIHASARRTVGVAAAGPPPPAPVPAWARFGFHAAARRAEYAGNVAAVAAADAAGRRLDFVLYGDSQTAFHRRDAQGVWGRLTRGLDALPLGMGGSRAADLAWRLALGGERPAVDPRAVGE